jgi:TetR/AcrR family transcriptional repressor of nem operon
VPASNPATDARGRLLAAAVKVVREKGFAATTIDDLCVVAGVTKGAFFHHFESKEAFGVAAATHWSVTTSALFASAPYHAPVDPLDRVLAYVDFRRALLRGTPPEFTCLVGTMLQETHETSPAIREACDTCIRAHAGTLVEDLRAAQRLYAAGSDWSAESLALHTQAVLQGAFILAKGAGSAAVAIAIAMDSVEHLRRYLELLMPRPQQKSSKNKKGRTT